MLPGRISFMVRNDESDNNLMASVYDRSEPQKIEGFGTSGVCIDFGHMFMHF